MAFISAEEVFTKIADKQRIVITGSEGTLLLAHITRHILNVNKHTYDYFENGEYTEMEGAAVSIIVASERLSGSDRIPDFLKFNHHIGVICNIRFTTKNGFTTEDEYIRQYDLFADATPKGGILAYCEQDPIATVLCNKERPDITYLPFKAHPHTIEAGKQYLLSSSKEKLPFNVSENHHLQYVGGAKEVLKKIGITPDQFYHGIVSYLG
jgi:UDP-N-acetylmuramate: L-alanyl-gamma-D-glutamyl-meso-diaminopimelate ligase